MCLINKKNYLTKINKKAVPTFVSSRRSRSRTKSDVVSKEGYCQWIRGLARYDYSHNVGLS